MLGNHASALYRLHSLPSLPLPRAYAPLRYGQMLVLRPPALRRHLPRGTASRPFGTRRRHTPFIHSLAQHASTLRNTGRQAWPRQQERGGKTVSSSGVDDLPQGLIPIEPLALEVATPAYPTVVLQALHNMRKFENCVLLTRVGGFYELYFEHAEELGPLMNLKVAQKRTNAGFVSMVLWRLFEYLGYLNTDLSIGRVPVLSAGSISQSPRARLQSLCGHCRGVSQ
jgi:hypothetical protein